MSYDFSRGYVPANDKFEQFHSSPARIRIISGGNYSGKTMAGAYELASLCLLTPGITAWACAPNIDSIGMMWQAIKWYFAPSEIQAITWREEKRRRLLMKELETPTTVTLFNGSRIIFKTYDAGIVAFNNIKDKVVWFDECPPEALFQESLLFADEIFLTMTPLNEWMWNLIQRNRRQGVDFWTVSTLENRHISQEYKDELMRIYGDEHDTEQRVYGNPIKNNTPTDTDEPRFTEKTLREAGISSGLLDEIISPNFKESHEYDWKQYVAADLKTVWPSLDLETKFIVYCMADSMVNVSDE